MIRKITNYLHYQFLKFFKPEIIGNPKRFKSFSGHHVGISNTTHISFEGNHLTLGKNVFIGHFNYIDAKNHFVKIGDHVQITNYCNILTHSSHHSIRFPGISQTQIKSIPTLNRIAGVTIGDYVYIGPHSIVMPGSSIGKGSIVSAYTLVNGHYPEYSILRGQPAKVIGSTKDIDLKIMEEFPELVSAYITQGHAH
jgi:acetyltransferase-like isoleucine patch superfamily enzyme